MEKLLKGVYKAEKKDKTIYYRASLTYKNKHISIGSYDTELDANIAYNEALELINSNKTILDYSSTQKLSFSKWVTLVNYRDNGLYISTPIYIHKAYFEYYLTRDEIFKFDIDDLFFYSSHKIMKRGRHFFVADYGMQLNIASRYGIKNHAVLNKDYSFDNGDIYDYRYSNIIIHNKYNGVCLVVNQKGTFYRAFIHINGNFNIGYFDTIEKAAIAYNKAAKYLMNKGLNKNFELNYLENLTSNEYEFIYNSLELPPKITNYLIE